MREAILSNCPIHGEHQGEVCVACYARQQERVERESLPSREKNTAPALRTKVLEYLARRNGR